MIKQIIVDKIDALSFKIGFSSSFLYKQLAITLATDLQFRRRYLAIEKKFTNDYVVKIIKFIFVLKYISRITLEEVKVFGKKRKINHDLGNSPEIIFLVGKKDGWVLQGIANDFRRAQSQTSG